MSPNLEKREYLVALRLVMLFDGSPPSRSGQRSSTDSFWTSLRHDLRSSVDEGLMVLLLVPDTGRASDGRKGLAIMPRARDKIGSES